MRSILVSLTIILWFSGTLAQSNSQRRFHYGQETADSDPFFATLLREPPFWPYQPLEYKCGGVWIDEKYVLTTAYCLKYHDINRVGTLKGRVTNWANDADWYDINGKYYFGNYSYEGVNSFENDIGLVRIRKFVTYPPAPFPSIFNGWRNPSGIEKDQVVLYGFGKTETGDYAPKLKYMRGRLHFSDDYSRDKCTVPSCSKGLSFCFEPRASRDRADYGDMGSPVYYKVGNLDYPQLNNRVLIGIVSDYHKDPRNIILTNVTHYLHWIYSKIHN